MKDFREILEVLDEQRIDTSFRQIHFRHFKQIQAGKFNMSIQGSEFHYCLPRKTVDLKDYKTMEIAIFENNEWVNPNRFKDFSRIKELLEVYNDVIGAYVPVDLIQDLYEYLTGV